MFLEGRCSASIMIGSGEAGALLGPGEEGPGEDGLLGYPKTWMVTLRDSTPIFYHVGFR